MEPAGEGALACLLHTLVAARIVRAGRHLGTQPSGPSWLLFPQAVRQTRRRSCWRAGRRTRRDSSRASPSSTKSPRKASPSCRMRCRRALAKLSLVRVGQGLGTIPVAYCLLSFMTSRLAVRCPLSNFDCHTFAVTPVSLSGATSPSPGISGATDTAPRSRCLFCPCPQVGSIWFNCHFVLPSPPPFDPCQ
jgi:hypothetical protein